MTEREVALKDVKTFYKAAGISLLAFLVALMPATSIGGVWTWVAVILLLWTVGLAFFAATIKLVYE